MKAYVIINRYGKETPQHNYGKVIPFSFVIKLPPPQKRGVDYGFKAAA